MENGNAEEETLDNKDEETRDEGTEPEEEDDATANARLTSEMLRQLAVHVCEDWKKLALQLGLQEDEIIVFEETSTDLAEQALKMLTIWMVSYLSGQDFCSECFDTEFRISNIYYAQQSIIEFRI